jgi:hypothetical protein
VRIAPITLALSALIPALTVTAQDLPPQDAPKDVLDFFRTAAEALADKDAAAFLDHFDPKMDGFEGLESRIRSLLERSEVGSSIEIVSDSGDEHKRILKLDWLLRIDQNLPKRQIVSCSIEKQGKKWRIVAFAPLDFFAELEVHVSKCDSVPA